MYLGDCGDTAVGCLLALAEGKRLNFGEENFFVDTGRSDREVEAKNGEEDREK